MAEAVWLAEIAVEVVALVTTTEHRHRIIEVANKNIGYYKYSFNPLQVSFMPEMYRPPPQTVQDFTTSMIKRDS